MAKLQTVILKVDSSNLFPYPFNFIGDIMNKNELLEMISGLEEDDYTLVETKAIVKKLMAYAKLMEQ